MDKAYSTHGKYEKYVQIFCQKISRESLPSRPRSSCKDNIKWIAEDCGVIVCT